jgi:hypothetical protein
MRFKAYFEITNDLFLAVFSHYITKKQVDFLQLDRKKLAFIENAIQKTANLEVLLKEWYSHYSPSIFRIY